MQRKAQQLVLEEVSYRLEQVPVNDDEEEASPYVLFRPLITTAGIYAGTLALCIVAYIYDQKKKQRRQATSDLLKEEQMALNSNRPGSYGTELSSRQL